MKRAFLLPILLCLLTCSAFAQSICTVSGQLYRIDGVTPAAFGQLEIIQTVKVGATISTRKIPVRANSAGLMTFQALQGSSITLKGDFYGYTRGVTVNVPNASTASLEDLVILSTVFTTLGDMVYAGVNGVPTRLPVGVNGKVLKVSGGIPSWQTESGGGGGGSLTVQEADGTPSVGSVVTFSFNQAMGFTVTDQGSDEARVSLSAVPYSALTLTGALLNADLAGSIDATKINTGAVTNTEFNYLDGVTSAIQTQFTAKANLASPALTGTPTAPTASNGTNTTQIATTAYVQTAISGISSGVVSFNSRTGTVTPAQDDYAFSQLASIPTTLAGYGIVDAQPLDSDLTALAGNSTNGLWARTGSGTGAARTITGTADVITVANGNGASGNPTLTIAGTYAGQASIATLGTITAGAWNADAIPSQYGGTGQNFSASTGFTLVTAGTFSAVAGTGSGSVVRGTAPTIAGGSITGLTSFGIRNAGTGAFDLTLAANETLTAGRTLTLVVGDAARTLTLGGSATLNGGTHSGTNTGDQTSVTGNAGTATALATARNINGVAFDGTADITVTAAAGTLSGGTLASGVTASSLTSFGSTPTIVTPSITTGFTIGGTAATGTIPRGNGTNFVASSFTMAAPGTSGNVLTSDGTNWLSSAPAGGGSGAWSGITDPSGNQTLNMSTHTTTWTANTAITNAVNTLLTIGHNTSGTAAANFGTRTKYLLESSTTADQDAGAVSVYWSDATHASRTSRVAIGTVNAGGSPGTLTNKVVIGNDASQRGFLLIQNQDTLSSGDTARLYLSDPVFYIEAGFGASLTINNGAGTNNVYSVGFPAKHSFTVSAVENLTINNTVTAKGVAASVTPFVVDHSSSPSTDIAQFKINSGAALAAFNKDGRYVGTELSSNPAAADVTSGSNAKDKFALYMKADKLVIAYNDGSGTVTYLTIPLDGSTTTWTQSTSAP